MIRNSHWLLAASLFLPSTATSLHAGQEDRGSLSQLALGEHCLRVLWKDWRASVRERQARHQGVPQDPGEAKAGVKYSLSDPSLWV